MKITGKSLLKKKSKINEFAVDNMDTWVNTNHNDVDIGYSEFYEDLKIAQENQLTGGIGDATAPVDVDPNELSIGQMIEMEHTDDPYIATEIALDHLKEDPQYYSKLKKAGLAHNGASTGLGDLDHVINRPKMIGSQDNLNKNIAGNIGDDAAKKDPSTVYNNFYKHLQPSNKDYTVDVDIDEPSLEESEHAMDSPRVFSAQYMASDGHTEEKTFSGADAIEKLKNWIDEWVGLDGEVSDNANYIVSTDGVGRVHVRGLEKGGLRTLLGRRPLPTIQGHGYGKEIAKTAVMLNVPKPILKFATIFNDDPEGLSIRIHFKDTVKSKRQYGQDFTDGYLYFHITEDKWSGDMAFSASVWYNRPGSFDEHRPVNINNYIKSTGNRDADLAEAEKLFKDPTVKDIINLLSHNLDKLVEPKK